MIYPMFLPPDYNIPPTLYSILNSYVNFDNEVQVKIKDLADVGRELIFDFDYPLSSNIVKKDFECMILKHFLMRRIGYDTMTAFKIALDVKLNEIMPIYNMMFDSLHNWDLLGDEEETRNVMDARATTSSATNQNYQTGTNTSDRRFSELPNNQLSNLRDGSYVTDYNYDTNTINGNSTDTTNGSINDSGTLSEIKVKQAKDIEKIEVYTKFVRERQHIYSMIFKELDPLFYGLV